MRGLRLRERVADWAVALDDQFNITMPPQMIEIALNLTDKTAS